MGRKVGKMCKAGSVRHRLIVASRKLRTGCGVRSARLAARIYSGSRQATGGYGWLTARGMRCVTVAGRGRRHGARYQQEVKGTFLNENPSAVRIPGRTLD